MDDWIPALKPFASLFDVRLASGNEALRFRNGSMVGLVSTTRRAGHGGTLDQVVIDEAFAQPDARLEQSLRPTLMTSGKTPRFGSSRLQGHRSIRQWLPARKSKRVAASAEARVAQGGRDSSGRPSHADPGDPATWASCHAGPGA